MESTVCGFDVFFCAVVAHWKLIHYCVRSVIGKPIYYSVSWTAIRAGYEGARSAYFLDSATLANIYYRLKYSGGIIDPECSISPELFIILNWLKPFLSYTLWLCYRFVLAVAFASLNP